MGKGAGDSMYGDAAVSDVKSVSVAGGSPKQALVGAGLFSVGLVVGLLAAGGGGNGDTAAATTPPPPSTSTSSQPTAGGAASLNAWGHPMIEDSEREDRALASFDDDVIDLLRGMTLEQKIGQTTQFNIDETFNSFGNDLPTDDGQPGFSDLPEFTDAPWDLMDEDLIRAYTKAPHFVGSWLNSPFSGDAIHTGTDGALRSALTPVEWRRVLRKIQEITIEDGGPPMVFGLDSVHGAIYVKGATIFPHQLNAAASFNVPATQEFGRITAKDTKAAGIPWLFAPILGIAVQPGWSRVMETFGEDPYLASQLGAATVRGMQGGESGSGPLSDPQAAAACAKHYIGYSNSENGHDRAPTVIPDRHLLEYFAPPFQAAFEAGAATVMNAYTEINGETMATSHKYLTELLRDEMGFEGMMVTDWGEIKNQHGFHHTAASESEATMLAMSRTTIDMSMVPSSPGVTEYGTDLRAHIAAGTVSEKHIDAAAGRVLQLKKDLGLLDDPHLESAVPLIETVGQESDRQIAKDIAKESLVLLQNDPSDTDALPTLPLRPSQRVFLTGPHSDSRRLLCGGWTLHWQGPVDDSITEFPYQQETIAEALARLRSPRNSHTFGSANGGLTTQPGLELEHGAGEFVAGTPNTGSACSGECAVRRQAALDTAASDETDIIVLVFGEEVYTEKPGDIDDLELPLPMREYARDLIATGKPVVAVLVEGRPRLLRGCLDGAKAVVWAGLPGPEGGTAIAELLQGEYSPSGRLPITYPLFNNGVTYYWHKHSHKCNSQGPESVATQPLLDRFPHWGDGPSAQPGGCQTQWDFGDGLSYTTFEYSEMTLSSSRHMQSDLLQRGLDVSVVVRNTGEMEGKHTIMLFLSDDYRIISPELKMLKRFAQVTLAPGASETVRFALQADDFSFYGVDISAGRVMEDGTFTIRIGSKPDADDTAPTTLHQVFTLGAVTETSGGTGVECSGPGDPNCAGVAACITITADDPCYDQVDWAMTTGVVAHPDWYPGLTPESSFEEFQCVLALSPDSPNCNTIPCGVPCTAGSAGRR